MNEELVTQQLEVLGSLIDNLRNETGERTSARRIADSMLFTLEVLRGALETEGAA